MLVKENIEFNREGSPLKKMGIGRKRIPNIAEEVYDRMEGLSSIKANENISKSFAIIAKDLLEEGFDKEDLKEFFIEKMEQILETF